MTRNVLHRNARKMVSSQNPELKMGVLGFAISGHGEIGRLGKDMVAVRPLSATARHRYRLFAHRLSLLLKVRRVRETAELLLHGL